MKIVVMRVCPAAVPFSGRRIAIGSEARSSHDVYLRTQVRGFVGQFLAAEVHARDILNGRSNIATHVMRGSRDHGYLRVTETKTGRE